MEIVMNVYLTKIRYRKDRPTAIIYAELRDASDKTIIISATLKYILDAIKERGYILVSQP